jgi:hypothetical protein
MNTPSPVLSLPADIASFIADLDDLDRRARQLMDGLSEQQSNWRPAGGGWSIAQCYDHVGLTNETYLKALRAAIGKARPGHIPFHAGGWPSRLFLNSLEPPIKFKVRAPKKIVPASAFTASEALQRLLASNQATRQFATETASLNLCAVRFKNPFVPGLKFTVATGLLIIPAHGRRHLWQVENIRRRSDFPAYREA